MASLDDLVASARRLTPPGPDAERPTTLKEKAGITAGAVVSLVIVGWLMVFAIAALSTP